MRGKVARKFWDRIVQGITPAYAGKRVFRYLDCFVAEDHPRVCGEKNVEKLKTMWKMGSPPRMRGKDDRQLILCISLGITPAYAGKSSG